MTTTIMSWWLVFDQHVKLDVNTTN